MTSPGDRKRTDRVDAEAARAAARHADRVRRSKPCSLCGKPMLLGQRVAHQVCAEAADRPDLIVWP